MPKQNRAVLHVLGFHLDIEPVIVYIYTSHNTNPYQAVNTMVMKVPTATIKGVIKTGRFEIPYRVYENDGPHLLCVNGIQQSMAMWQSFVSRFAADYRIVLFNFPFQGKGRILSGPVGLSLNEEVDILYEVMKTTRVNHDVSLCTASWGGVVALAFASQHHDAVKRLMLGSIGTRPNQRMTETIEKGCTIDTENRGEIAELIIQSFGQKLPESIKKRIGAQFRSMSTENLQAFCKHGLNVISAQSLTDHIDLKNIKVETVLVRGEEDTIIDLEDVVFFASQIPNCQLRIIKDVGHFLHLESEAVLDVYQDLLGKDTNNSGNYLLAQC
jgi:pimeloyl-ACP methyl ester carboxylesterase